MTHQEVADRIEGFIREQFEIAADDPRFDRGASLFDRGHVDSMGVAELLVFLEESLGTVVPDAVLLSDEFESVDGIARIVLQLQGAGAPTEGASRRGALNRLHQEGVEP